MYSIFIRGLLERATVVSVNIEYKQPIHLSVNMHNNHNIRRVPFSWVVFQDLSLIQNMVKWNKNKEMNKLIEEPS